MPVKHASLLRAKVFINAPKKSFITLSTGKQTNAESRKIGLFQ
jgi:hypothetical protein